MVNDDLLLTKYLQKCQVEELWGSRETVAKDWIQGEQASVLI
jgi:hypothetical protein